MMKKNLKFVRGTLHNLDNPEEFVSQVKTIFENAGHLEETFQILDASDFPHKPDWNRVEELDRSNSVMLSENNIPEKSKYIEMMLKKLKISTFHELDDIFLMSESLQYIIDYYKKAEKVAEMSSTFAKAVDLAQDTVIILLHMKIEIVTITTKLCHDIEINYNRTISGEIHLQQCLRVLIELDASAERERMVQLVQEDIELYDKSKLEIQTIEKLWIEATKELNTLLEMNEYWGRHVMHFKIKHGLLALKPVSVDVPMDLSILEELAKLFEKVEGLRNLVLLEKSESKKAELESQLSQGEQFLKNYLTQSTTSDQIRNIVAFTNEFISMATKSLDISYVNREGGMMDNMKKYRQLSDQQKKLGSKFADLLAQNEKIPELIYDQRVHDETKRIEL
ncbi:hypothetical protein Fcan01_22948 [Folsomia candida]|uniref:Uncharacterized protein n=2 Tax=Folsomia candida TaxID=158441 RepID=A0A226DAP4_FOLCA|nr:hypothetical protein Fcan01_22948 [Folsomia candida]